MDVTIKKKQETVDGVVGVAKYTVRIKRQYGTGDFHWSKDDMLFDFDEEEMRELARRLSEKFLTS